MTDVNEKIFKGGVDIGNKNYKISIDEENFEFPIAYREISEYSYKNEEVGRGTKKVFYNGKYYIVGLECNNVLPKNKGNKDFINEAMMIKLTGLGEFLKRKGINKGEFNLVMGTPINDFEEFQGDYMDLLLDDDFQSIIVDNEEYSIKVSKAHVTKQCAAVAPTIKNWKDKPNLILIDLGGGTADIAYFRNGTVVRYITIDFTLNKIMEELGTYLNGFDLGLMRPDETDSGYLDIMEQVIKEGRYLNVSTLEVDGETKSLEEVITEWLQVRVDEVINNIYIRLGLSKTVKNAADVYYFGGGAKLLRKELSQNETFANKTIIEDPEMANVKAYDTIANVREW